MAKPILSEIITLKLIKTKPPVLPFEKKRLVVFNLMKKGQILVANKV